MSAHPFVIRPGEGASVWSLGGLFSPKVRGAAALRVHEGTSVNIDLWGEAVAARAFDRFVS